MAKLGQPYAPFLNKIQSVLHIPNAHIVEPRDLWGIPQYQTHPFASIWPARWCGEHGWSEIVSPNGAWYRPFFSCFQYIYLHWASGIERGWKWTLWISQNSLVNTGAKIPWLGLSVLHPDPFYVRAAACSLNTCFFCHACTSTLRIITYYRIVAPERIVLYHYFG